MCVCEGAGGKLGESVCVKLGALSSLFYTAYMYESHCPLFRYMFGTCLELQLKAITIFISSASGWVMVASTKRTCKHNLWCM